VQVSYNEGLANHVGYMMRCHRQKSMSWVHERCRSAAVAGSFAPHGVFHAPVSLSGRSHRAALTRERWYSGSTVERPDRCR
jgi:hypothetical protein